jgi:ferredoxin
VPEPTRWRVDVDAQRCTGAGLCAGLAPDHFSLSAGRSRPPSAPVDPDEAVLSAAECCPMEAIRVTDPATGHPVLGTGA